MAQQLLKRVVNSSAPKEGDKQEAERQAYLGGERPGLRREMPFLKSNDPWTVERKKQQEEVTKQYLSDKKNLTKKRQGAERELKRQLSREKDEIDRYYRLRKLKESDPRLEKARRDARHKYELIERKMLRKHKDFWRKQERTMQTSRDKRRRKITKDMKKEHRRARGLKDSGWGGL